MSTEEQKLKHKEANQRWRDKNPSYNKEYKQKNKQRCKEIEQKWRNEHKQEKRDYDKEYRAKNKDAITLRKQIYHAHRSSTHKRIYDDTIGIWVCQICGVQEGETQLDIHHKDQNKLNNSPSNLICLCKNCHHNLHMKWNNEVIPSLINAGIVDWQGNVLVNSELTDDI